MPFEVKDYADLPENQLLVATLKSLEHRVVAKRDPRPGEDPNFERLKWTFEITEQGPFHGRTIQADTPAEFNNSQFNPAGRYARALLKRDLTPGQVVHESDFEGLSALIEIFYQPDRQDPTKKWARIKEIYELDPATAAQMDPPF